ncbi:hypothetical protein [Burkholderia savannae]|uniref:hypothetical protein n=1 Tax=Burkholderia savannae TaxID=1637837 RepID=UPI001CF7883B|nr:hypothetical protein [Burkholderia savannae]
MSIYQLFGAEFAEISTSLRTKSVENPNVENALWIVLSRGRLRRDESARRGATRMHAHAANRFPSPCRSSDCSAKVSSDQCVVRPMLRMSTSLPTKIVDKARLQIAHRRFAEC